MRRLLLLFTLFLLLGTPVLASAQKNITDPVEGLKKTAQSAALVAPGEKPAGVATIAGNVIGTALSVIGVVFFLLTVYGGFTWMTARGNEQLVTKGRETIIAAILGMIIVFGAYALTSFVLNSADGSGAPPANEPAPALEEGRCNRDQDCDPGRICRENECVPDIF